LCRRYRADDVRFGVKLGHRGDVRRKTALPPKAEVHPRCCYVANVPKADIGQIIRSPRRRGRATCRARDAISCHCNFCRRGRAVSRAFIRRSSGWARWRSLGQSNDDSHHGRLFFSLSLFCRMYSSNSRLIRSACPFLPDLRHHAFNIGNWQAVSWRDRLDAETLDEMIEPTVICALPQ
jgi:hypothetical protein